MNKFLLLNLLIATALSVFAQSTAQKAVFETGDSQLDSTLAAYSQQTNGHKKLRTMICGGLRVQNIAPEAAKTVFATPFNAALAFADKHGTADEKVLLGRVDIMFRRKQGLIETKDMLPYYRELYEKAAKTATDSVQIVTFSDYMVRVALIERPKVNINTKIDSLVTVLLTLEGAYKNGAPTALVIDNRIQIARAYNIIQLGRRGLTYLLEANSLLKKNPAIYKNCGALAMSTLALIYYDLRQYQSALPYALKAVHLLDKGEQGISNLQLTALLYLKLNRLDSADYYLTKTEHLSQELGRYDYMRFRDRATYCIAKQDYANAAVFATKADSMARMAIGNSETNTTIALATALTHLKRHNEALKMLTKEAKEMAGTEEERNWDVQIKLNAALHEAYKATGDYKKASEFGEKLAANLDSLMVSDKENAAQVVAIELDITQKDFQIEALNIEKRYEKTKNYWLLGGLFLALLALSAIIYLYKKQQTAKQTIQVQADKLTVLIRELHHRVKNNLQIVSSLLNIQARSVQDEKARKSIKEGKLRIEAMSIIHQRLYMNEDITELNMLEYVEDLVAHLARSYGYTADTYTLHLSIKPLCCDIDNAVPIGLMLNEVLTNAFKYAFPNNPAPMLWVTIENEKGLKIQVRDNGLQVPNVSPQGTGFGTKLIQSLSSDLNATTTVEYNNGYSFNLTANAGSR